MSGRARGSGFPEGGVALSLDSLTYGYIQIY